MRAEGLGQVGAGAQRAHRAAEPRIEQVAHQPESQREAQRDQTEHRALGREVEAEQVQRRNAREAVEAAQRLDDAQPVIDDHAPGQRGQRQVVAAHRERERADARGRQRGERDAGQQRGPARHAVRHREVAGRVGADADEGRLAEGDQAREAGHQREPERHRGVEQHKARERDVVARGEQRHAGRGRHGDGREHPGTKRHEASCECGSASERHSSSGTINANTMISLAALAP